MAQSDRDGGLARKRDPSRQDLVEQSAERIDVAPGICRPAGRLFRGDVVARSEHGPRLRQTFWLWNSRDPEIGHARASIFPDDHVLGLHVTVHEAVRVRESKRLADLDGQPECRRHRKGTLTLHKVLEVFPFDMLEDDVLVAVSLPPVENGDDVRVAEARGRARFTAKPLHVISVRSVSLA